MIKSHCLSHWFFGAMVFMYSITLRGMHFETFGYRLNDILKLQLLIYLLYIIQSEAKEMFVHTLKKKYKKKNRSGRNTPLDRIQNEKFSI